MTQLRLKDIGDIGTPTRVKGERLNEGTYKIVDLVKHCIYNWDGCRYGSYNKPQVCSGVCHHYYTNNKDALDKLKRMKRDGRLKMVFDNLKL